VLEERLRQQRIRMLGPQSETLSNPQLELLAERLPASTFSPGGAGGRIVGPGGGDGK
jgi:hypothetical protein